MSIFKVNIRLEKKIVFVLTLEFLRKINYGNLKFERDISVAFL